MNKSRLLSLSALGVCIAGGILISPMTAQATSLSSLMPTAGFAQTVEGGMSIAEVKSQVETVVKDVEDETTETVSIIAENTNKQVVDETIHFDKEVVEPVAEVEESEISREVREHFSNLVIAQVNDYVNVRDYPDENEGNIVGKLYDDSVGNFIEETNGWYLIESGNCKGYVKAEYCVTGQEAVDIAKEVGTLMARVNTTTLKVREEASTESSVLGLVPIDDELIVTEELEGWVKVDIEEGFGYVSTEFVDLHTEFVKAESKEEEEARLAKEKAERDKANEAARRAEAANGTSNYRPANPIYSVSGSGTGVSVANYGLQFVGNPYVYGGTSLTNGADCSGFVMSVYKNFGVSLPHSSSADRSVGYDVGGLANAQPGDIVCYSGHVAIYIGNGQIVHASTAKTGIIVSNATYRNPICVRRIF